VFEAVSSVLAWLYSFTNNYAAAIALFTLVLMVAVTPLTLKATKGMLEMQRIQPELKKIQEQFKGDRQRINEETMALFKEHKVKPLGGCLPMLLQAPIFIVIYQVLAGVTRLCTPGLIDKQVCTQPQTFAPDYLNETSKLFKSLFGQTEMLSFGLDLSKTAASIVRDDAVKGVPYVILVLVVAGLSYFQQWQISSRNTSTSINRQQQILMRVIPGAVAVFQLVIPAGLIFYFLMQSVYRILQNFYITRKFYGPGSPAASAGATDARPSSADGKSAGAEAAKGGASSKPKPSAGSPGRAKPAPTKATSEKSSPAKPAPRAVGGTTAKSGQARPAPRPRPAPPAKQKPRKQP